MNYVNLEYFRHDFLAKLVRKKKREMLSGAEKERANKIKRKIMVRILSNKYLINQNSVKPLDPISSLSVSFHCIQWITKSSNVC